jgi:hypothetical protein
VHQDCQHTRLNKLPETIRKAKGVFQGKFGGGFLKNFENRRVSAGTEAEYYRKREKLGKQPETMPRDTMDFVWFDCFISLQQEKFRKHWPAIEKKRQQLRVWAAHNARIKKHRQQIQAELVER